MDTGGGKHGHYHSHWGHGAWGAGCARPWASVPAPSLHPYGPRTLVHCLQGVERRKPLLSHLPSVTSLLSDDKVARGWAALGRAGLWAGTRKKRSVHCSGIRGCAQVLIFLYRFVFY